jgi:hypothetical protein
MHGHPFQLAEQSHGDEAAASSCVAVLTRATGARKTRASEAQSMAPESNRSPRREFPDRGRRSGGGNGGVEPRHRRGFDPVMVGGLTRSKDFDMGTPGRNTTPSELRKILNP